MKVIMVKEKGDSLKDCRNVLDQIRHYMEDDFEEITEYKVKE